MSATRRPGPSGARGAALALAVAAGLALPAPAGALYPELSAAQIREAIEAGTAALTQEEFGEEWRQLLPGGEEVVAATPFSRLAHAARLAAVRGEPLTDKQRQEQLDRGKGKLQLTVTMYGRQADFARWYEAGLRVGERQIKAAFTQNERTARRLEDGRFAARNIYVFPLEGLPPRGTVTLTVQRAQEQRELLRASVDLGRMR